MKQNPIPYSRQSIDQDDIDTVCAVLRSRWLTTGPAVEQFEKSIARTVECNHGVAFSSGTAALHGMMSVANIQPGDEVIVPAITFVASGNAVLFMGGTPVFADVLPSTLLIDPADVQAKINQNTKAILAVDYAGQPCDYPVLRRIADQHQLLLLSDSSHSLGATLAQKPVAAHADMTAYSFHPVKPITTGEGGMVATDDSHWDQALRRFRGHGINVDFRQRAEKLDWRYEMESLGFNYRMCDLQAALGTSQLRKLDSWLVARQEIADRYRNLFKKLVDQVQPLQIVENSTHAYHLFVVRWRSEKTMYNRDWLFQQLRNVGIGVNVHYEPIYRHPYYQKSVPTARHASCPVAEAAIDEILSLPIFPGMANSQVDFVVDSISRCMEHSQMTRVA